MTFWEVRILHTPLPLPLVDVWQGVNRFVKIAFLVFGMSHVWGLDGKGSVDMDSEEDQRKHHRALKARQSWVAISGRAQGLLWPNFS